MAASAAFPPISRSTCSPIDEASGCDVATHPLVQTTDERREVKGSGGGDEDTSAALSVAEECQSAMMGGRSGRFLWYHVSTRHGAKRPSMPSIEHNVGGVSSVKFWFWSHRTTTRAKRRD